MIYYTVIDSCMLQNFHRNNKFAINMFYKTMILQLICHGIDIITRKEEHGLYFGGSCEAPCGLFRVGGLGSPWDSFSSYDVRKGPFTYCLSYDDKCPVREKTTNYKSVCDDRSLTNESIEKVSSREDSGD